MDPQVNPQDDKKPKPLPGLTGESTTTRYDHNARMRWYDQHILPMVQAHVDQGYIGGPRLLPPQLLGTGLNNLKSTTMKAVYLV